MKKVFKNKKGFTLIELIVVVAIIAILAAIAIPTFSGVMESARQANTISIARNAYTLAKINLLEDEIAGIEPAISTADPDDQTAIVTEAGADGTDDSVTYASDVLTVVITEDGWVATIEDGELSVVAE